MYSLGRKVIASEQKWIVSKLWNGMESRTASTAASTFKNAFPGHTFQSHKELYKFSIEQPQEFWGSVGRRQLQWFKDFNDVMRCDITKGEFEWFLGGKLNATVNCVDRHCNVDPNRVALIWEKDEPGQEVKVSYKELSEQVARISNVLKNEAGVKRGDVVGIYMPVSPLAVASMLACARIGAVHTVIFAGFSAEAIASRLQDSQAVAVITSDESVRGGKSIPLKQTVDAAIANCPTVKHVFVVKRTGLDIPMAASHAFLQPLMERESQECAPEVMDSEDPLFLLYTSGSTGKPKGMLHTTAGYLAYVSLTQKVAFNYDVGDVFGCVADIGWITGHSYVVYGPLVNGATSVLFESTPTYPDPGRYWETVQRLKINQFYGAPTAIRLLMKYGDEFVTKYDRSSLKTLGCVGEPLNHEAWAWFNNLVGEGKCPLVDTWWQTETGGICIAPRPAEEGSKILPSKPMRPMFGIEPVLCDEKGAELPLEGDQNGALCLRTPWPGIARTILGDHDRYVDTYFKPYPGFYFTGDGGHRDIEGFWQITGRMDDVINVTGHRLGTAEVEDALDEHPAIAEAAVVGYPHEIKGESVYAYVVLKETTDIEKADLEDELKALVKQKIAGYAVPEKIQFCTGLPKTRSGKIMRRILRKVAANNFNELGDTSTLAEPSIVEEIIENHKQLGN